jgi:hypothetical protein
MCSLSGEYIHINYLGECRCLTSDRSITSLLQAFATIHGPHGCAGFGVRDGVVDTSSWAGEPFAIVDYTKGNLSELITSVKTPIILRGCIAVIFSSEHNRVHSRALSPEALEEFYVSPHPLQWFSTALEEVTGVSPV